MLLLPNSPRNIQQFVHGSRKIQQSCYCYENKVEYFFLIVNLSLGFYTPLTNKPFFEI